VKGNGSKKIRFDLGEMSSLKGMSRVLMMGGMDWGEKAEWVGEKGRMGRTVQFRLKVIVGWKRRRKMKSRFECGDTTHFIADYPKRKKLDSSNKYNYTNRNDSNNKGDDKKKYHFADKEKKF
jgi:hypothetical protein